MPLEDQGCKGVPPACSSGGSIDVMPDVVLEHILGFLPAEDAVRTSVLAPRWRHLWKSATGLRVGCRDRGDAGTGPVREYRKFLDRLFLLRGGWPLETCEIRARIGEFFLTHDAPRLNNCVRQAIQCKVIVLKVYICPDYSLRLDNHPFVSQHLTRLELHNLVLHNSSLDFSSCPVLEHLELNGCGLLEPRKIVSESLKRLRIVWCFFNDIPDHPSRIHIRTPNLVSLHLDDITKLPPMLHSMPSLVEAFIRLTKGVRIYVTKWMRTELAVFEGLVTAHNADSGGISCVLLNGLSQAKSLTMISTYPSLIASKGDLSWCPMFSNLKTLLLNDHWCVPDDFDELACILEHSPVLEKLTLQLFSEGPKHNVEMKGGFSFMGPSATISEHLDKVEIKCEVVDEKVLKVLEFLSTFNICFSFC